MHYHPGRGRALDPGGDRRTAPRLPPRPGRARRVREPDGVLGGPRRAHGRELGEGAQGPVAPGLVRHPRGRVRRRLPRPPDPSRAGAHAALADRDRGDREPRARARQLPGVRRARVPADGARRQRPGQGRRGGGRAHDPARRGPAGDRRRARRVDRRDLHARARGAGRRRRDGPGGRPVDPQLRAGGAGRPGGRLGAEGRPGGRAPDPDLLRAAQGRARGASRGGGRPRPAPEPATTSRS